MTIQRPLIVLAVVGAIGGVLLFLVAGSTEGGPPGTSQHDNYEQANRIIAIPWFLALIGLIGLLIMQVRREVHIWRAATLVVAITGTILVLGGNVAEFVVYADTRHQAGGHDTAWAAFLLGHLILVAAGAGFAVGTWRSR